MKKILAMLTAVVIIAGVLTANVAAKKSGDWEYSIKNDKATITKYTGNSSDVKIPSKLGGKKVTSLGKLAFESKSVTSVKIPDSVTSIGEGAFGNCSQLTEITLPNGVTKIGKGAFMMSGLREITIPSSVKSMGDMVFYVCLSLSSVTFKSKKPPTFGTEMFVACPNLNTIYVPKGAKSAYEKVDALKGFTIKEK